MNDRNRSDPWRARLSEHLEGELDPGAARELEAHLTDCEECRAELAALRALVSQAKALPDRGPTRDLWPALDAQLNSTRRPRLTGRSWIWAIAAAVVLAFTGSRFLREDPASAGTRYLLLLHEPPNHLADADAAEIARVVDAYRNWGRAWSEKGNLVSGEKLADREGFWLRPGEDIEARSAAGGIGGFFLIRADDYEHALVIARSHPHLDLGGSIEVRRIEET